MDDIETPLRTDKATEPTHYKSGKIEPIHLIESQGLNFVEGCIVKYVCRHSTSGKGYNDLLKALWYLERLLFTSYSYKPKKE